MNVVKCVQCKIVINELLSYVQNKVSVIDEESLVRVCSSAFNASEIKNAKSLLFDAIPTEKRKINRKNAGKEKRDLNDIINLFKSADPDIIPTFVAKDLDKLPPITFDHLDCSKLLKDMVIMKTEIENIKSTFATNDDIDDLKREVLRLKTDSLPPASAFKVNTKRGAYLDSGPMGLSHDNYIVTTPNEPQIEQDYSSLNNLSPVLNYKNMRAVLSRHDESLNRQEQVAGETASAGARDEAGGSPLTSTQCTEPCARAGSMTHDQLAAATSQRSPVRSKEWPSNDKAVNNATRQCAVQPLTNQLLNMSPESNKDDWQTIRRKKRIKYRFIGKAGIAKDSECNFKAADKKIPIFITNVHLDTKECDIIDYIQKKTNETVVLERINMKKERMHKAYKFMTSECNVSLYLDEQLWPAGIIFRRFVSFKHKRANSQWADNGLNELHNG